MYNAECWVAGWLLRSVSSCGSNKEDVFSALDRLAACNGWYLFVLDKRRSQEK